MKKGDKFLISADFLEERQELPHEYLEYIDCRNNIIKAMFNGKEYYLPKQVIIQKKETSIEIF